MLKQEFYQEIFPQLIGRKAVGGENWSPVTVNVKLNYKGIMMRQRERGKMKASSYSMEACREYESLG